MIICILMQQLAEALFTVAINTGNVSLLMYAISLYQQWSVQVAVAAAPFIPMVHHLVR